MKWLRWLMGLDDNAANARITQEQAMEIARHEAISRGWEWKERIHVWAREGSWFIVTNANSIGGNVRVHVDQETGAVIDACWISGCPAPSYVVNHNKES